MKKELKLMKKTAFIQILELVASVIMGFGIKDRLSRQSGERLCIPDSRAGKCVGLGHLR